MTSKTTKMFNPDTDKRADVHPDEVENMKAVGWRVVRGRPKQEAAEAE